MKYLIKKTYTATENNPNFAGKTETWFCGKNGKFVKGEVPDWYIKEYTYSTKAAVTKGLVVEKRLSDWEMERGFWNINLEVVEV